MSVLVTSLDKCGGGVRDARVAEGADFAVQRPATPGTADRRHPPVRRHESRTRALAAPISWAVCPRSRACLAAEGVLLDSVEELAARSSSSIRIGRVPPSATVRFGRCAATAGRFRSQHAVRPVRRPGRCAVRRAPAPVEAYGAVVHVATSDVNMQNKLGAVDLPHGKPDPAGREATIRRVLERWPRGGVRARPRHHADVV